MQQNSTPELLVKHLYNETNTQEANSVKNALANDVNAEQEFSQFQAVKQALDESEGETPDVSVIQNILAYSQEQELTASH